jgi:hypothetical protein
MFFKTAQDFTAESAPQMLKIDLAGIVPPWSYADDASFTT